MIFSEQQLGEIIRAAVKAARDEGASKARVTNILAGNVEDLDSNLDIVYVRMDQESMGSSPYQSDNYGAPGIIPATRVGEAATGDQVRLDFNGPAGATAS